MSRLSQVSILFLFAAILLVNNVSQATAAAFTPDAAFKMRSLGIAPTTSGSPSAPAQPQAAFGNDRNMQLSLIGQENIRKSITVPPAYEDYMAVRQRFLLGLLGPKH